jgi:ferredoxin
LGSSEGFCRDRRRWSYSGAERQQAHVAGLKEGVVRVEIDRDRCEGNAVCLGIAPDIFDLDDEDYAVVKKDPIPADEEDLAEQAIAECPRAAILRKD